MTYASIIVEMLRVRPRAVFWLAALAQVVLWMLVATLVYSAPPGDLAQTVAIGREFRIGTIYGPPLAYWLADIAFDLAGGHMVGPYLLAEGSLLLTLWSLMQLGRSVVGQQQAVLAILLMVGVSAISIPVLDFGPWALAMPLWSLALLYFWRAVGEGRQQYWLALAVDIALLLLTSYLALIFAALLAVFIVATRSGRATLRTLGPWLCLVVVAIVVLPYALWLMQQPALVQPALARWGTIAPAHDALIWAKLVGDLVLVHLGALLLIVLASGWPFERRNIAPAIARFGLDPLAAAFVPFFAFGPPLAATLVAAVYLPSPPLIAAAPVVVLTALATIVIAGKSIMLHRQLVLAATWGWLLLAPPLLVAASVIVVPRVLPVELRVAQPASAIGRFFAETFQRRTGQPLQIVTGDPGLAALLAASAVSRPRLYIDNAHTPWLDDRDIRTQGAVVLWPARDVRGTPPPGVKARFPDLVVEVPQVFERPYQALGSSLRVGWAVIRPRPNVR